MRELLAIEKQIAPVFLGLNEQRLAGIPVHDWSRHFTKNRALVVAQQLAMGHGPGADHMRPLVWCTERGCGDDPERPEDHEQSEAPEPHPPPQPHPEAQLRDRFADLRLPEPPTAATQHETRRLKRARRWPRQSRRSHEGPRRIA